MSFKNAWWAADFLHLLHIVILLKYQDMSPYE